MADIIVQDITPRNQYIAGGGGPTVFNYTFPIFANTDINVYQTPAGIPANDVTQILVYNIGYTVTNNVSPAVGGFITLAVGANVGDIITIVRNMPDNRLNNYIDGGLFQATDVNTDFDRTVFMAQQNKMYDQTIGVHYNNSEEVNVPVDTILPILPANSVWMKNAGNTAIIAQSIAGGIIPVPVPIPFVAWNTIAANQILVIGNGYFSNAAGNIVLTLPAVAALGSIIIVYQRSAGSFTIAQNAGQQIQFGNVATTLGVAGSITSTNTGDSLFLVCDVANTNWVVLNSVGNLTIV